MAQVAGTVAVAIGVTQEVIIVAGRAAYRTEVAQLEDAMLSMRAAGMGEEATARMLSEMRREIGVKYKALTLEPLRTQILERNIKRYGDPLGPSIEWFRSHDYSWLDIIKMSMHTGGKDLGL